MLNYNFELIVNLLQSIYFVGFFLIFLGGRYSQKCNIAFLAAFVILHFAVLTYFTFINPFILMLDMMICILLYEVYCFLCLKGERTIKIILPFVTSLTYTIISYGFLYLTSLVTGLSLKQLGLQSSLFRYFCVGLVNLTMITVLLIIWRTKAKEYSLKKISNIIAFVAIPILTMAIIYITVYILILTNYQSNLIMLLSIICISMVVIAVMVWFMIARINRDNQIAIKLLLSEQRANLYENNIINSNKQIENTVRIRHDMKNNIACIDNLILKGKYDEAHKICQEVTNKFSSGGTIVNTDNSLLNAVLNVEIEKARLHGISVKLKISDNMKLFINGSDIISIIGNLCDNAITYLSCENTEKKEINFSIENTGFYTVIRCSNKINGSVLSNNPLLPTNKNDKKSHGKGISIIKGIADKYGGDMIIMERDNNFIVSVILDDRTLPEN